MLLTAFSDIKKLPEIGYIQKEQLVGKKNPRTPGILPISHSTLDRMIKLGEFPKPINLSTRRIVWSVETVREWMEKHSTPSSSSQPLATGKAK